MATSKGLKETICSPWASVPTPEPLVMCYVEKSPHSLVQCNHSIAGIRFHQFCSVQFSHSVVSDSLRPHELQHARPPCPLPTPGACSNSCPLSRGCHPTISSSAVTFSCCLPSFPASGSFPVSRLFTSGGQRTGASAIVLSMNSQG